MNDVVSRIERSVALAEKAMTSPDAVVSELDGMLAVSMFVDGVPAPKGSGRVMLHSKTGRPIFRPGSSRVGERKLKSWSSAVMTAAVRVPLDVRHIVRSREAVAVEITFLMPRPKRHYRANGEIRDDAVRAEHVAKPDIDKLLRSTLDGMEPLIGDDCKVCEVGKLGKYYTPNKRTGALIAVKVIS